MEREFVPYEQALVLKELGFDENCLFYYTKDFKINHSMMTDTVCICNFNKENKISAPFYQQAFTWFREKYNLHYSISILQRSCRYHFKIRTIECESDLKPFGDSKVIYEDGPRKKYEDIELDCLKKLIEIIKDGK
jgi:hypothetical protein